MFASPAAQSLRGDTAYPALTAVVPGSVYGTTNPGFSKNVFDNKFSSFPSTAPVFGENFVSFADAGALQPGMSPDVVTVHVKFRKELQSLSEGTIVFLHSPEIKTHHGTVHLMYNGVRFEDGDRTPSENNDITNAANTAQFRAYFCGIVAGSVNLRNGIGYVPLAYQNTVPLRSNQLAQSFLAGQRVQIMALHQQNASEPEFNDVVFAVAPVMKQMQKKQDGDPFMFCIAEGTFLLDANHKSQIMQTFALTANTPYLNNFIRNIPKSGATSSGSGASTLVSGTPLGIPPPATTPPGSLLSLASKPTGKGLTTIGSAFTLSDDVTSLTDPFAASKALFTASTKIDGTKRKT